MNVQPLLNVLGISEDAVRAMADGLRTQIGELHARLREAETHLEHLAICRKKNGRQVANRPLRASGRAPVGRWWGGWDQVGQGQVGQVELLGAA